jgi:hypothetical protein
MSAVETLERRETVRNPTVMAHMACSACHPDRGRAWCGCRLAGLDLGPGEIDCHVCAEMRVCPECGVR